MFQSQTQTGNSIKRAPLRRPPRPTTAKGPRAGLAVSVLLHAALIAATYFTWSHIVNLPEESHAVPVDLITVARQTNVQAMAPPPPPTPPKIVIPTPQIEPPALPKFEEVEPAPEPVMPKFKIAPEKKQVEKKPPAKKKTNQDFAALLNKLTAQPKTPPNAKPRAKTVQAVGAGNAMTADLADALKSQIYRCWSPPVGAPNANDLVVDFDLTLNPDGTPGRATSDALNSSNPYTRAAAEAARRAIFQCQPYKLPPERYSQWREINPLRFDPRQMMGQ